MNKSIVKIVLIFGFSALLLSSCSKNEPEVDCNNSGLVITYLTLENSDCNLKNGSVELAAFGGSGDYRFRMNNGFIQQSNIFSGLEEGGYIFTVIDSDNCTASEIIEIGVNNNLLMSTSSEISGCTTSAGSITIVASGGEGLEYSVNEGPYQTSSIFANLKAGEYIAATRDSKGCTVQDTVRVLSGTSYNIDIAPLISANCSVTGCHDGQSGISDWTNLENVQDNADNIQSRTSARTMPPGGSGYVLTDEQIDLIACWVEDGAIDN